MLKILKPRYHRYVSDRVVMLPVGQILPNPLSPRRAVDSVSLAGLAASIKKHGVIQPLTVRRRGKFYELISGERRLRAAELAHESIVPCIVLEADARIAVSLAMASKLFRRELDFTETADGLHRYMTAFGLTSEEAAESLSISPEELRHRTEILSLGGGLLYNLRRAGFGEEHARSLLRLGSVSQRSAALRAMAAGKMSPRVADEYVTKKLALSAKEPETEQKEEKPRENAGYLLNDVRPFLNCVERGLDALRRAGHDITYVREDSDSSVELMITLPLPRGGKAPR